MQLEGFGHFCDDYCKYCIRELECAMEIIPLGISSPHGFEFVRNARDQDAADAWVLTPTDVENTMNVYHTVPESWRKALEEMKAK